MKPIFNYGFNTYTKDRKFTLTDISGWKRTHYVPDKPNLFGLEHDCFVYTAGDETQMIAVNVTWDEVNLDFYFREKLDQFNPEHDRCMIPVKCSIGKAIKKELDLNEIDEIKVHLVESLPDITELETNAFYLVRVKNEYILYLADAEHAHYLKIESRSSAHDDFKKNVLLLASTLESGDLNKGVDIIKLITPESNIFNRQYVRDGWDRSSDEYNDSDKTVRIMFSSINKTGKFKKLIEALEIFRKHCKIPDLVVDEISSYIKNKKDSFVQDRIDLAKKISNDSESSGKEISHFLEHCSGIYGRSGHVISLVSWYAVNGNLDIAIFLCMNFPPSNSEYLAANKEAQHYLLSDEYDSEQNEHYITLLSTVVLRIAVRTMNKDDVIHAARVINRLELKDAFDESAINSVEPDLLVDLIISKAVEIRHLKEGLKIGAPSNIEGAHQSASVSSDAQLRLSQKPELVAMQNNACTSAKGNRRKSI